ncbi:nucleotidyl transferase AbiEii/AbiGii toxin family protein [Corynebacterium macginleyi]|uniref:nucleotidyl transferase AbiEii/AbiGii toxin family protein n=1 Tax=Corynebacterium macginleyi TaxID=38290 RepID=UPI00190DF39A|nr:nucleotidyl transferase AbiEii/AbiGii toxin family protein [Corynebacterium macginleyi]MBK4147093.1 nucleotidyl transferase AbiEii/AbiGii toxin family protein [Corynebacterium macginleyi]
MGSLSHVEARNWQRSVSMRMANLAKSRGRTKDSIKFQLVFECFLTRLFSEPSSEWILKGGTALLMRNGSGRFTRDVDLARAEKWDDPRDVVHQLEHKLQRESVDPFTFKILATNSRRFDTHGGYRTPTMTVNIEANLGGRTFHRFRIDVTLMRHTQVPPEIVEVDPLLNLVTKEGGYRRFSVAIIPVEAHLADKICAMQESHGNSVSMRFHDLADIIQIIRTQDFSAEKLLGVLDHEVNRRGIDWPGRISSPGNVWEKEYARKAATYAGLPPELHSLHSSLSYAGLCLDEVLSRQRLSGKWDHRRKTWLPPLG